MQIISSFSGAQKPKTQIQPQQMIRPPFYLNQQQLQTLQYLQQLNPLNPQQQQLLHQLQHQFRMMQQHQHQQRQQQVRNNIQRPDQYTYQVSVYLSSISILTKYQYTDNYT